MISIRNNDVNTFAEEETIKQIQNWIDSLKIALLESNSQKAFELTQNLPFHSEYFLQNSNNQIFTEYLDIAKELIAQCITLLQNNQEETRIQLDKIRQMRKFLS